MKKKSILKELKVDCPFTDVITDTEEINGSCVYKNKIMHFRADYDGYRWWNTVWPYLDRKSTPEQAKEIDEVFSRLISENAFKDFNALSEFCFSHPNAMKDKENFYEYNFYCEGEYCLFWVQCYARRGDYNIYLHAYKRMCNYG